MGRRDSYIDSAYQAIGNHNTDLLKTHNLPVLEQFE